MLIQFTSYTNKERIL